MPPASCTVLHRALHRVLPGTVAALASLAAHAHGPGMRVGAITLGGPWLPALLGAILALAIAAPAGQRRAHRIASPLVALLLAWVVSVYLQIDPARDLPGQLQIAALMLKTAIGWMVVGCVGGLLAVWTWRGVAGRWGRVARTAGSDYEIDSKQ